jgi:hypothetical protein
MLSRLRLGSGFGLALILLGLLTYQQIRDVAASPIPEVGVVNRALKGDRLGGGLPPARSLFPAGLLESAIPPLPDGCEALVSQTIRSPVARIPGRCVS